MSNHFEDIEEQPNDFRVADLLHSYIFKKISEPEMDELESWANASEINRKLFSKATNEQVLEEGLQILDFDPIDRLESIKEKLHFSEYEPTPVRIFPWRRIAAASIVFIIGILVILYLTKDNSQVDILPGRSIASLNTTNSATIKLDTALKGIIASDASYSIISESGRVRYIAGSKTDPKSNEASQVISTPRGGTYAMVLADGTRVWLNPSSSINFPPVFPGDSRRVTITGEVCFEIARVTSPAGFKTPFIIEIKDRNVRVEVLGTHFNINAYPDEDTIKTTLVEGALKVVTPTLAVLLKPGQQADISNQNIEVKDIGQSNAAAAMAWKDGYFNFQKGDIKDILKEIARWYNIEIEYEGELPARHFGGSISRKSKLNDVLRALEINGIKSHIKGNKLIISTKAE